MADVIPQITRLYAVWWTTTERPESFQLVVGWRLAADGRADPILVELATSVDLGTPDERNYAFTVDATGEQAKNVRYFTSHEEAAQYIQYRLPRVPG